MFRVTRSLDKFPCGAFKETHLRQSAVAERFLKGLVIKYKDENNHQRDCVYQKIYNIIELQKFNNKFQVQNSNILTKDIILNIKS